MQKEFKTDDLYKLMNQLLQDFKLSKDKIIHNNF